MSRRHFINNERVLEADTSRYILISTLLLIIFVLLLVYRVLRMKSKVKEKKHVEKKEEVKEKKLVVVKKDEKDLRVQIMNNVMKDSIDILDTGDKLKIVSLMNDIERNEIKREQLKREDYKIKLKEEIVDIKIDKQKKKEEKEHQNVLEDLWKYSSIVFVITYILFSMRYFSKSIVIQYLTSDYVTNFVDQYMNMYFGYMVYGLFGNIIPFFVLLVVVIILSYLNITLYSLMMFSSLIFLCLSNSDTFYSILSHVLKGVVVLLILIAIETVVYYNISNQNKYFISSVKLSLIIVSGLLGWLCSMEWVIHL